MLQGLQPNSVLRGTLRSRVCLAELLHCLQAFFLQGIAQFGALQTTRQQRLHGHCPRGVHGSAQVVSLWVGPLFQAEAAAGVHLAGRDKLFETLRAAEYVETLQQLEQGRGFEFQGAVAVGVELADL